MRIRSLNRIKLRFDNPAIKIEYTFENKLNEIIGMIILKSIGNGFKIINFSIDSSYDIIINRQIFIFMYRLNVKHIQT